MLPPAADTHRSPTPSSPSEPAPTPVRSAARSFPELRSHRRRRPCLDRPTDDDPSVLGMAAWRRAVGAGRTILSLLPACLLLATLALIAATEAPGAARAREPEADGVDTPTGLVVRAIPRPGEVLDELLEPRTAPLLATDLELRITGPVARARLTQRFVNPHDRWIEGVYTFPLPEGAAVDSLRMVVGDRIIEGQMREKRQARKVYEQAKTEGRRASLLEQHRPNLFTSSLANIGPGDEVEVEIELQYLARWDTGSWRLRFPLTFTPRYQPRQDYDGGTVPRVRPPARSALRYGSALPGSPGRARTAGLGGPRIEDPRFDGPHSDSARFDTARQGIEPATPASPESLDHPLRLTIDLESGVPLRRLSSPHHQLRVVGLDPERGRYRLVLAGLPEDPAAETVAETAVRPDRDLELVWTPRLGSEPRASLFTQEVDGDTYALLQVLPPDPELPGFTRLSRETVFVLDVSGSMQGASIRQAKAALDEALERLQPEDSFNVLAFNQETRALFPGSWPATPQVVEDARRWVKGLSAGGGTEMLPALLTALDSRPDGYGRSGARDVRQVIFLTDGAVSNEDRLFSTLEQHLGRSRLYAVGIGSAPNAHLLRRVAELGRGSFTFIGRPEQVAERMGELLAKIETPALTGLEVLWDDPGAESYPERVPDLHVGEPLVLASRLLFPGDEVRLTATRDGLPWGETLPVSELEPRESLGPGPDASLPSVPGRGDGELGTLSTADAGLARLWARRKITHLMDRHRRSTQEAERQDLRRRVLEVALAHRLLSPFTSLVAVDATPVRPQGSGLRSRRLPNATPAGAEWTLPGQLPVGGTSAPASLALGLALLALAWALRRLLLPVAPRPVRRRPW